MTNLKPMLAHKYDDKRVDWSQPVYIQPKLDGVRCLFTSEGAYSRNGKQFKNLRHIEIALESFFNDNPDAVLDGELYNHDLKKDFEKIISLVKKQKPTQEDKDNATRLIQFHVYDYFSQNSFAGMTTDLGSGFYSERMNKLSHATFYGAFVKHVETHQIESYDIAIANHKVWLEDGYEGSIIRLDGLYKHGRSYELMKFKDFSDAEATIVGYELGQGKREGTLGKFIMMDDDGNRFGCPPGKGFDYGKLRNILRNVQDYMGTRATFTYFQRTNAGSYRHPLFKAIRNYE